MVLSVFYLKVIFICNHDDYFVIPVSQKGAFLYFKNLSVFFFIVWRWWMLIYQSEKVIFRWEFMKG